MISKGNGFYSNLSTARNKSTATNPKGTVQLKSRRSILIQKRETKRPFCATNTHFSGTAIPLYSIEEVIPEMVFNEITVAIGLDITESELSYYENCLYF